MNDLIAKIPSLLTGRYLLAYFIPVLVLVAGHAVVAAAAFGFDLAGVLFNGDKWNLAPSIVLLLAVVASSYVLAPFYRIARAMLEGAHLPGWMARQMRSHEARRRNNLERQFNEAAKKIEKAKEEAKKAATKSGEESADTESKAESERVAQPLPALKFNYLRRRKSKWVVRTEQLETKQATAEPTEMADIKTMDYDLMMAQAAIQFEFSDVEIHPTRIANLRAALRQYAAARYGMDFELFWGQLAAAKAGDAAFEALHEASETRMQFVTNMFFVACTFFPWLLIGFFKTHLWLLSSIVAAASALAAFIYYRAVVESFRSMIIERRAAIDIHRFDVMKALRLPKPQNLDIEKRTWTDAHRHVAYGEPITIAYEAGDWK